MIIKNILRLIGNTPLLQVNGMNIFAKAEFLNPSGSIKDRVALKMIEEAEKNKELKPGMSIIEPSSGNTGISVSLVGKVKGYPVKIVIPENIGKEKKKIIKSLDAEFIEVSADAGIKGAMEHAQYLAHINPCLFLPNQFNNPYNYKAHYTTTGHEIWEELNGNIDCFISGIGSGGTLQGIGLFLKERNPAIRIIAVEPKNFSAILGHEPGLHQIEGIGDGFIPEILDVSMIDDVIEVSDRDAIETCKMLNKSGILAGISSGANIWAADKLLKQIKGNIVTVLPDRIERYLNLIISQPSVITLENMKN